MIGTDRERVLAALEEREMALPDDGLTLRKIRERAFWFRFEPNETLSFRIERHPTMYLSDAGVPGLDASPARFHVVTEYRYDLTEERWHSEELSSTFEYEPWMVIEAELGSGNPGGVPREQIEAVEAADDPEAAFEDAFGSLIEHWKEKFDELDGRQVPEEDREAIVELLVSDLEERAGID